MERSISILEADFRIYLQKTLSKEYRFYGTSLLSEDMLNKILGILSKSLQQEAPNAVTASLFSKYYGSLVSTGALYTFAFHNLAINVSLDNIDLDIDENWNPVLLLGESKPVMMDQKRRSSYREALISSIFANNLTPVFHRLGELTGLKEDLLWANVAFAIHWNYQKWVRESDNEELKERIIGDFAYLTQEASPELFGLTSHNPLKMTFETVKHPFLENQTITLRKQCCLKYLLPKGKNCTTCPNIDEHKRAELFKKTPNEPIGNHKGEILKS